jgi:hypothetical protein
MAYGAGYVAATQAQASAIIDPRPWAAPPIARVYQQYPQIGPVLPAMGYSPEQMEALGTTLNQTPADLIVSGTPIDLGALLQLNKPIHPGALRICRPGQPCFGGLGWTSFWLPSFKNCARPQPNRAPGRVGGAQLGQW